MAPKLVLAAHEAKLAVEELSGMRASCDFGARRPVPAPKADRPRSRKIRVGPSTFRANLEALAAQPFVLVEAIPASTSKACSSILCAPSASASLLAPRRLDVDRFEPTGPEHLGDAAGIVAIRLVGHGREGSTEVTDLQAGYGQF